jgi:hypothetical protein
MNVLYLSAAVVLLLTIIVGLGHVFRQPGHAESLLAAVLGVAFVLRGWPEDDTKEDRKP